MSQHMVAKQISYNQIRTFKKPCKAGLIVHTHNESFGRFLGNKTMGGRCESYIMNG